ncbi:ATP-binding protein [Pseudahrensia aquimaris]|uniref:ATP-binding protein n=1 Tax=Pseudahrensia aquimaris TaxID=744461 RepID=A0ABW3FMG8_9HYPH
MTEKTSPEIAASLEAKLDTLIELIARAVPAPSPKFDASAADAFVWTPEHDNLSPVAKVNRVDMVLLQGIDQVRDILLDNTRRFANGLPANNALLWGARGMGKSSLVKAAQATVNEDKQERPLKLVEIHREDIDTLPRLLGHIRNDEHRFILFCDDLSFDHDDTSYKALKAALDGGVEGRPDNAIFYATSNRRHLMPRDMIENERSTSISPSEAVEEKVSLSDRFGLWLGFHKCSQDEYLAMIEGYLAHYDLGVSLEDVRGKALEWSTTRGSRSGRVAWQFVLDLAGELGKPLT